MNKYLKIISVLLTLVILAGVCGLFTSCGNSGEDIISVFHSGSGIDCITCDGSGKCILCDGSGTCGFCDGEKRILCNYCRGTDICKYCGGDGDIDGRNCVICRGIGCCINCDGGYKECTRCYKTGSCYDCDGSGKCITCDGTGKFDETKSYTKYIKKKCSYCKSTDIMECDECENGVCNVCNGEGKSPCSRCYGSGICPFCNGDPASRSKYSKKCWSCGTSGKCAHCDDGKVECTSCKGLGICNECRGVHSVECPNCCHGYYYEQITISKNASNSYDETSTTNVPDYDDSTYDDYSSYFDDDLCTWCGNNGYIDCPNCVTGKCIECSGDGYRKVYTYGKIKEVKCSYCRGSGICRKCNGQREIDCPYC